jgi:hypothetical protein
MTLFGSEQFKASSWARRWVAATHEGRIILHQDDPCPSQQPRLATTSASMPGHLGFTAGNRPCRARPANPVLIAEGRSAPGVREQTGPEPLVLVRAGSAADG